ncbi:ribosome maturation factor RimM [Povalibacter sp.]|uniref:ribosome maturation factor RimM n=1 Tax=Povalibacter sp. TaxID=1962978 RepID=UPI002F4295FC
MTTPAQASDRIVILGKIVGTFGIKGWVKIKSYTEPVENILGYEVWKVGKPDQWQSTIVEEARVTDKGVLAKLKGLESPEEARLKVGLEIGVWRSEMPPPAPGEYYLSDLEGIDAVSASGELLGRVDHFRSTPGGTVVIVRGEQEHWIPFVKDRIVKVELDARRIVLDWSADW